MSKSKKKIKFASKKKKPSPSSHRKHSLGKTRAKKNALSKSRAVLQRSPKKRGIALIRVVGIGGAGGKIVTRMTEGDPLRGVEFIAVNTDAQDLDYSSAHKKIYIGKALTRGLGAGMNPEIGKQAAEENRSEIGEIVEGTDILFIVAGMGGGTGTGAAPIIADIAREKGILTIGIVTKPFTFEGPQRSSIAHDGLIKLREKVDALVVVPNDKILGIMGKETSVVRAFGYVDDVLRNAVRAISELINVPGLINVDFADIKAILQDAGTTLIGIGLATGQERSVRAVQDALTSPLLDISIDGAKRVLFSIGGSRDLKMTEVNDIAKIVSGNLDANARVIFGAYYDKSLKDKHVKVTVIASGFNNLFSQSFKPSGLFSLSGEKESSRKEEILNENPSKDSSDEKLTELFKGKKERRAEKGTSVLLEGKGKQTESQDLWDIPAFLRKKRK